ncbi:phage neck terminator protein [Lacticaseibacillus zhaodongensis]|uniref:phage neck terminator protein n=1 Tax=Lacticaseibacillus zhaodongensis TaxID=2668065 RepID=UPI0012D30DCC|nr:hypothetical protein [Lacticaseibacillus zhaodongensis]
MRRLVQAPHYDYKLLYSLCSDACEANGLHMRELGGKGPQPEPPFVSFDIISPHIRTSYVEDDPNNEFAVVLSLTVYDLDRQNAYQSADALRQCIGSKSQDVMQALRNAGAVLEERMPLQVRNITNINEPATMVGFDFKVRVSEPYTEPDQIEKINFEEETNG